MAGTKKDNRLGELLDMERLQTLQDNLAKALGLAFVTVDYRGRPVTRPSGFTHFCSCMRDHEHYGTLCNQCYAHGGLHATMEGKPYIYRCHGGLVEFAVPLMMDGTYLGAVMGGQCDLIPNFYIFVMYYLTKLNHYEKTLHILNAVRHGSIINIKC